MRVGVTGAGGFIGSALVSALTERGDDAVAFVRPASTSVTVATIRWDPSRGQINEGDLRREGTLDAVVNLAGAGIADHRWTAARRAEVLTSRVAATALLVEALQSRGDATFLANGSAIGYYGARGDEVITEATTRGTGFLADVSAEWEDAAAPEGSRVPVACLRSGIVLDAEGGALARQLPLFRFGLGGALGSGRQWMSPISLVDEVRAILWILDRRLAGPFNLTAPNPVTNREFTRTLGQVMIRPTLLRVPAFALGAVLGRELASEVVLASQRVVPRALEGSGFTFRHADVSSALKSALGPRH